MPVIAPSTLLAACKAFSVDPQKEPHLLWILREYCCTPLPPTWSRAINDKGDHGYVNDVTGEGGSEHPAKDYFLGLIERGRAEFKERGEKGERERLEVEEAQTGDDRDDAAFGESADSPIGSGVLTETPFSSAEPQTQANNDWMEFIEKANDDSVGSGLPSTEGKFSTYFYNFSNGDRVNNKNVTMRVVTAPDSLELAAAPTKDSTGGLLNNTGNLLRRKSHLMPRLLKFISRWAEGDSINGGLTHRTVLVIFDTLHDTLQLKLDGDGDGELYHCDNVQGLTYLDMHVGKVVICMGRATTLMQAGSLETSKWYDIEYKRLKRIASVLSNEIKKYDLSRVS